MDTDKKSNKLNNNFNDPKSDNGLFSYFRNYIAELWRRRKLVTTIAYAELQQTVIRYPLSYFWWLLEPALLMLCYVFLVTVLGRGGPRQGIPFWIFVSIGIMPWFWTSNCIGASTRILNEYKGPISQIHFPNLTLVLARFIHETTLYVVGQGILILALFILGFWPNELWLYWPVLFGIHCLVILTGMIFFSAASIYVPDLEKVLPFVLRLWFYGSPILWDLSKLLPKLSPKYQAIISMNPLAVLVGGYRQILIFHEVPSMETLLHWIGIMLLALLFATAFFINREKYFSRYL